MINDFHANDLIPSYPTKTISLDCWPSVPPKGSGCESTMLLLISHPENIGKIVLSQLLPLGGTEGQQSNEIVFVGYGGIRSFA